jgi:hypothetical protein
VTIAATENNVNIANAQQNSASPVDTQAFQAQTSAAPDTLIKDLYDVHAQDMKSENDRIVNGKDRKYLDKYFDKNLADLIWKDLTTHTDEVGVIDFDLFYNAQDFDIKNLVVSPAKIEGAKATVPVSFSNYNAKELVTYLMTQENGAWKISDIKYKTGDTLLKLFKEDAQNNAAQNSASGSNFEGTYQVGDTTCTIKPVKMAFELKWAKGAGTMMFFYAGKGVLEFSSEDKGKGVDTFLFDDDTYKTGKFTRADGKVMTVKKIG